MRNLKMICQKTKNIDAVRRLLGHFSVTATSSYIVVTDNSELDLARTCIFRGIVESTDRLESLNE